MPANGNGDSDRRGMDARDILHRLRGIVNEKLRADHGDSAVTREPVISEFTGYNFGDREVPVDYLAAIAEAERIARVAQGLAGEYAREARRHGRDWYEISEAFGIDANEFDDPAVEAYQRVAGTDWYSTTSWRCGSCEQRVTDRGPWESHPSDVEHGHAADCERHLRDVRAYGRRRDGLDHDPDCEGEPHPQRRGIYRTR